MAKAREDFRWRDVSLASWQWEQWISCFFSASQFDHAHHFSLGFARREIFFGSEEFIFVVWLVVGFCYLAFVFFFILSFVCLLKTQKCCLGNC